MVFIWIKEDGNLEVLFNYIEKDFNIKIRRKYNFDYKYDKMICCFLCYKLFINSGVGNFGKFGKWYKVYYCDWKINGMWYYEWFGKEEFEK